jgi:hypothetical protein
MDQRSICFYLNRKRLSAQAIHDELIQVLGSDAIVYSMVTFYLCASRWMAQKEEQHSDRLPMVSTKQFSRPLIKSRSRQCKNSQSMCISRARVWWRLTGSLGPFVKHLHWARYPPDTCAATNLNRSVKRIAQTLRVCTDQWLTKFYDLRWVLVLFVDKPRKSLPSSGRATPWKDETHDLTVDTLRGIFAKWVERLNRIPLNEGHYYR